MKTFIAIIEYLLDLILNTKSEPIDINPISLMEPNTKPSGGDIKEKQNTQPVDPITLKRIGKLHPKVRDELNEIYYEIRCALTGSVRCRFSEGLRTFSEQDALYAKGRTAPGKVVTNARGGMSPHNYGLAVDIVLLFDKANNGKYSEVSWDTTTDFDGDGVADWMEIVEIFKFYGWVWGGDFKSISDKPHFEKTFGKSCKELFNIHASGKVDSSGYVIL